MEFTKEALEARRDELEREINESMKQLQSMDQQLKQRAQAHNKLVTEFKMTKKWLGEETGP